MISAKNGVSAKALQRLLRFGSYQNVWAMLHRFRTAMVRPGRDRLAGIVEVDETFVGGVRPGKSGRGAAGKAMVVVAVEQLSPDGLRPLSASSRPRNGGGGAPQVPSRQHRARLGRHHGWACAVPASRWNRLRAPPVHRVRLRRLGPCRAPRRSPRRQLVEALAARNPPGGRRGGSSSGVPRRACLPVSTGVRRSSAGSSSGVSSNRPSSSAPSRTARWWPTRPRSTRSRCRRVCHPARAPSLPPGAASPRPWRRPNGR